MTEPTPGTGTPTLPPIGMIDGDNHADAASYLYQLVWEAVEGRNEWTVEADRNVQIYTYGADPTPDDDQIVVPDIQNQVQAVTDTQTKEPISVALEPVERGDPPICYYAGPQQLGLTPPQAGGLGLETQQVATWLDPTGQPQPPQPLSDDQADQLRDFITAGGMPAIDPVTGMQTLRKFKPDWLIEINDQFIADFYQGIFDVYWVRSGIDESLRANLLSTNIHGWALWLYEFDGDEQKHIVREMSVKQMYIDPTVRDISLAAYAGVELVLDRDEAKKLYPSIADVIQAEAQIGIPVRNSSNVTLGQAVDRNFRRPTISMTIFWLRNQDCLYTPEQAIAGGHVEAREVPDAEALMASIGSAAPADEGAGMGAGLAELVGDSDQATEHTEPGDSPQEEQNEQSNLSDESASDTDAEPEAGGGGARPDLVGDDGEPLGSGELLGSGEQSPQDDQGDQGGEAGGGLAAVPQEPAPIPTRIAHFIPGSDVEINPGHPDWPTYRCIRQIIVIGSRVVEDKASDYFDIPILHNVCRPIPQRPWGIGEPYVLWKLQNAKSRVLQSMVDYADYFGQPASAMSQSMAQSLEDRYDDVHVKPGVTLVVEDELYKQMNGQIHTIIQPPPMPDGLMKLFPTLDHEIDDAGGYNDAMQGNPSPEIHSGRMLESMQAAGASIMSFKSQRTADMVKRLGHEMLHSLVHRLDVDDLLRINRKYPRHVVEAVVERAREIEWQVTVTVSSGSGMVQQRKAAQAGQDRQLGAISLQTYQEARGIDPRQEDQRMDAEAKKQARRAAMAAPPMAPAAAPAAPPPGRAGGE